MVESTVWIGVALALVAMMTVSTSAREEVSTPQSPVEFTGHLDCGPAVRTGREETDVTGGPVASRSRGDAWRTPASMSDPRLTGRVYISYDEDDFIDPPSTSVGSGTWRIENDAGAWQGSYTNVNFVDHTTTVSTPLVGEGAYEGLTAIWESVFHPEGHCTWDVRGLIIEGGPPRAPEPYLGE